MDSAHWNMVLSLQRSAAPPAGTSWVVVLNGLLDDPESQ